MRDALLAALAGAESVANGALRYDPASQRALQALAGKVLQLHLTEPGLECWLILTDDGINLRQYWEGEVNCRVQGKLVDLLSLARQTRFSLAGTGVNVQGETALLQQLQQIARNLDIDWEDALAARIGDTLAHPLAQWLRRGHGYVRSQASDAAAQLEPWLSEELALLPTKPSLEKFTRDVQSLTQATDRLEARLNALRNKGGRA